MEIKEANIFNFGKIQQKTYTFAPGINVIYGENETGKTTLHTFLLSMLFGMEKGRGRANLTDSYTRYEPWHAPAFYSGALRFEVGGKPFYLERNFYHREKRELLRNEADGEELSVAYGDLTMLLGGIGRDTFENTYNVPQCGVLEGKKLTEILAEYLSNAAEGGDSHTNVSKAVAILDNKKKELNLTLRKRNEEKEIRRRKLEIEKSLLEEDCGKLRQEVLREEKELRRRAPMEEKAQQPEGNTGKKKNGRIKPGVWITAVALLAQLIAFLVFDYSAIIFGMIEVCLALFLGIMVFLETKSDKGETQQEVLSTESAESEESAVSQAWQQARRMLEAQKEQLLEKETRLYNITEQMQDMELPNQEERELLEDMEALELASAEIQRLAKEYGEEMADELNGEVSRWVSLLTNGAYDSVQVDINGKLRVESEGREIAPEALSRGTLEQFYLAFRIAVGEVVMKDEDMPLFLDETFCMYDDRRLGQTLQALARMKQQVFIFTCQKREIELLEKLQITYHKVSME